MRSGLALTAATLLLLTLTACESRTGGQSSVQLTPLAAHGKAVYQANCTACHSSHPELAGSVGPAVAGSSRELLEARVLRAEYPAGYQPKRRTHLMAPLPQLKGELDAIHAYLNSK